MQQYDHFHHFHIIYARLNMYSEYWFGEYNAYMLTSSPIVCLCVCQCLRVLRIFRPTHTHLFRVVAGQSHIHHKTPPQNTQLRVLSLQQNRSPSNRYAKFIVPATYCNLFEMRVCGVATHFEVIWYVFRDVCIRDLNRVRRVHGAESQFNSHPYYSVVLIASRDVHLHSTSRLAISLDQKLSGCITWGTWGRYTHSMQFNRIFTPNISPWNLTYIYANMLYLEHPPKHLSELQNGIWNADAAHIQTLTFTQHMLAWRACHMYVDTPHGVFWVNVCLCVCFPFSYYAVQVARLRISHVYRHPQVAFYTSRTERGAWVCRIQLAVWLRALRDFQSVLQSRQRQTRPNSRFTVTSNRSCW